MGICILAWFVLLGLVWMSLLHSPNVYILFMPCETTCIQSNLETLPVQPDWMDQLLYSCGECMCLVAAPLSQCPSECISSLIQLHLVTSICCCVFLQFMSTATGYALNSRWQIDLTSSFFFCLIWILSPVLEVKRVDMWMKYSNGCVEESSLVKPV